MADHIERIATLEEHRRHQEHWNDEVIERLDKISMSVDGILLNIEGKSGFFKGVLFMVGIIASCFGGAAAWLVNKYYGH